MYSWFEFNLAVFLCQETTFMSTNQKSNVKIDWYEQQIRFSECSCSYHITQMSEANECNWTNIKFSSLFLCQSNLIFVSFLLNTRMCIRRRARPRDYFFLNVLFASANKNKYSQQNHKWTCGCCLLILNYFLPLVSKNSRSLSSLILTWFILFVHGRTRITHKNKTKTSWNKNRASFLKNHIQKREYTNRLLISLHECRFLTQKRTSIAFNSNSHINMCSSGLRLF